MALDEPVDQAADLRRGVDELCLNGVLDAELDRYESLVS